MYYKKLLGDRIYLSPKGVTEEEIEKYTKWLNDFNVTDYIGRSPFIVSSSGEKEWLEKSLKTSNNRDFNIIDIKSNQLIGSITLERIDSISRTAVLGIFIGDDEFRSKGYGSEAINLILEYGFKYLNLHNINLDLLSFNERAHKCYLKCGFKDAGRIREAVFINGNYYDRLRMDILDTEFIGDYIRNKNI